MELYWLLVVSDSDCCIATISLLLHHFMCSQLMLSLLGRQDLNLHMPWADDGLFEVDRVIPKGLGRFRPRCFPRSFQLIHGVDQTHALPATACG